MEQITPKQMAQMRAHFRYHPEWFFKHWLKTDLYPQQVEICNSIVHNRVTTVASCNAAGKTDTAGGVVLWYLMSWDDSIVVSTAPKWQQVKDLLWRKVNTKWEKASEVYPLSANRPNVVSWDIDHNWFAVGVASKDPNKIQGYHADSGHLLVIIDEAAAVDEPMFEGVWALMTAADCRLLMLGNPTSQSGTFRDSHKPTYPSHKIRIDMFDTPNFAANNIRNEDDLVKAIELKRELKLPYIGLKSPQSGYEDLKRWGIGSPLYQARCRARFPEVGENNLIPLNWIEKACSNERLEQILGLTLTYGDDEQEAKNERIRQEKLAEYIATQNTVRGVDVARFGCFDDQTEILTDEGWKLFRDLSMRHKVLTLNPETMIAQWGPITKIHQYEHHGEMNLLETERLNFCITDNHQLLVKTHPKSDKWTLKRYDEIAQEFVFKRTNNWDGHSNKYITFKSKKRMPHGGYAKREWTFTMNDWAEFLGWFVSEGNVYIERRIRGRLRIMIAQYPGAKRDRVRALLDRMGIAYREINNQFEISNNVIGRHLINYCGVGAANKRIPRYIKEGSTAVIETFLEAYRLGDGTCRKDGTGVAYGTSSKLLADDVQESLVKIGRAGKVSTDDRRGSEFFIDGRRVVRLHNGYTIYQRAKKYDGWADKRDVKRIRYDGNVYCVTTPYHTIMVRRKGITMWSGNSDSTVIQPRWGAVVGRASVFHKMDTMATAGRVWPLIENKPTDLTAVDVIGVGAGVVDRLHELQDEQRSQGTEQWSQVVGVNVADRPTEKPEGMAQMDFANLRAELYWRLRNLFERGDIYIMPDENGNPPEALMDELCSVQYKYLGNKIYIEEKADMKKRLQKSPDRADALMLSLTVNRASQWTTDEPVATGEDDDYEPEAYAGADTDRYGDPVHYGEY